jgi:oligopeptidase B
MDLQVKKTPKTTTMFNDSRIDNYDWLRDKNYPIVNDPEVLAMLNKENEHTAAIMDPRQDVTDKLYQEFLGRIKLDDSSVPIKDDDYYYYSRTEKDSQYQIFARKKSSLTAPEEIIFDENNYAGTHNYFKLGGFSTSPDHTLAAYSTDISGEERYIIKVKNLESSSDTTDIVHNTIGNIIWHEDGKGFFYNKLNDNWRVDQIFYHKLGTQQKDDLLVYQETDATFSTHVSKSSSKEYILVNTSSQTHNDVRFIAMNDPNMELKLIEARKDKHLYDVDHRGDSFYIRSNDTGTNFRLVKTSIDTPAQKFWQEIIPTSAEIYLEDFDLHQDFLLIATKEGGLSKFMITDFATNDEKRIDFPDPTYAASAYFPTFDATGLRIAYSSLSTPDSILEYNLQDKKIAVLKEMAIPSGYDKSLYQSERIYALTQDNLKVPISLVYKKSLLKKDGSNPLYLYGYGSYGMAIPPAFSRNVISLLDRGFVYAIAHIRGGDDLGYKWYETAKFLTKKNTFDDFIASSEHLINNKYTSKGNIVLSGRSAGGLLVGACVNMRPELYKALVTSVPFVDVLNTMLDETLPLTPGEFKEWGNPKELEYYQYIKSYSPYDNVTAKAYPHMYITAGLNDPRVTYWEPAKWVAKLRELKTDQNLLLFKTNMEAGHGGKTGRFSRLKELAEEYNFVLMAFGLQQ